MRPIFDYLDYHAYLKDFYEEKKGEHVFFSYRYMGQKLGLDAGFLVKVLQGKMHLAIKAIPKVVSFCALNEREAEYFEVLVRFCRAKSVNDTKIYFEKLIDLRGIKTKYIEEKQYAFYKKWYHSAIRSILGYYTFTGHYKALGQKLNPPITVKQAKESITLLTELGLIRKNEHGYYQVTDSFISTGDIWRSVAIHAFQQEMLQLSMESLDRFKKEARDVSTLTIAASHKDLDELRERVKEFRQSVLQMKTGNQPSDIVYQINIQIFPLAEPGAEQI